MSAYYKFHCANCNMVGGSFTRQMWGWGNFDIIETFKFLAKHTGRCGSDIHIVSENDEAFGAEEDTLLDTEDIFPCSNDWKWVAENWVGKSRDRIEVSQQWLEENRREGASKNYGA